MQSAHELLTRWPALDVAAKRARLEQFAAPLARPRRRGRAARRRSPSAPPTALWRGDPSAWSRDAACRKRSPIASGGCDSPLLMADSIDRLQDIRRGVKGDGFTDVVLLGMGGSSLAPEVLRAVIGIAPGWPRLHMLDSTDPAAVRAAATPPEHTLYLLVEQIGHDHRAELAGRAFPPAPAGRRHRALGRSLRRHHRCRHRARSARARRSASATASSTRPTSAAATRRCRSSAWCRRR